MVSPLAPTTGTTFSRTLVPTLPPHFLSRKHLFPLIENNLPGSTVVIAPPGFGKTTLISEWASHHRDEVIWLAISENDGLQEMSTLFIQATRNLIPGFAPWFEANQPMKASEVVKRWGDDLLATRKSFIFVLDNLREDYENDVNISNKLIKLFPSNIHFVAIRRTPLDSLNALLIYRGGINAISAQDLRFSEGEIQSLAENLGVDLQKENVKASLQAARGWPSAVSLILHQLKIDPDADFASLMKSQLSPLAALAQIAVGKLDSANRERLRRLSIVEEFSHDLAHEILGDLYSFDELSSLGNQGEILSLTSNPEPTFLFSPLMRSILIEELSARRDETRELHSKLSKYFIKNNRADLAMDHAFAAGDQATVSRLFRDASRIKHAQGKGDDILRWSVYAGNSPVDGVFKRETMEIAGLLCNLDYPAASSKIEKLRITYEKAEDPEFFAQFTESSAAFIYFNTGNFSAFESSFSRVFHSSEPAKIEVEEQVMLLRLGAECALIFEDSPRLLEIEKLAEVAARQTTSDTAHAYLGAIKAMALFERGDYRRAFEAATVSLSNFNRIGIVGLLGPVDVHYVLARCLLEFARREEAFEHFERASSLARQWSRWPWFVMAESYFVRDLALHGRPQEALERIGSGRDLVQKLNLQVELQQLIDLSEIFTRHQMGDFERLEILLKRGLTIRFTEQIKLMAEEQKGHKFSSDRLKELPEGNPRERIWKYLAAAIAVVDSEKLSVAEMKKALKIGSEVGARETFLRQGNAIGSLIIKIAHESPTVYNEELAREMTERMKERELVKTESSQSLTKREKEILSHLATGRTLTSISADLHISQNTMKTHLKNLYKKLDADGRNGAVEKAKTLFLL